MLDLGAAPDSKDPHELTPLYYSVSNDDTVQDCTFMLLQERARVGICDEHGWYEIHQVSCAVCCMLAKIILVLYSGDNLYLLTSTVIAVLGCLYDFASLEPD